MKHIVLFGAGKSATVLITFLKKLTEKRSWKVTVIDGDANLLHSKIGEHEHIEGKTIDILNEAEKNSIIQKADIVISLLPPQLHLLIAKACLQFNKNLLTASYIDDATKSLSNEIEKKGLLFLYEMGLDPGIDHMSAMQIIDDIKKRGGTITSFKSHCGGLIAPESIDNPWFYKLTWNPRNIVLAGKTGAIYLEDKKEKQVKYENLFSEENILHLPNNKYFGFYANRDSLSYIPIYGLDNCSTFIRTTLRFPEYIIGWKKIVDLKLTDEEKIYQTNNLSLANFYQQHLNRFNLTTIVDEQLLYFGWKDDETIINKGLCSAADVIQTVMEEKLALTSTDKDMIIMLHEFEYVIDDKKYQLKSLMEVLGEDRNHTAMAKTVGLPLGIATELILDEVITIKGLHIPTSQNVYKPVLSELKKHNIVFEEFTS